MRDSFGGAFMLNLMMIFIVIFVSFMAVALTYAKAFRVKNGIINRLEQYQFDIGDIDTIDLIDSYLSASVYNYSYESLKTQCSNQAMVGGEHEYVFTNNGACIIKYEDDVDGISSRYFRVFTYIPIRFPFLGLDYFISIVGETQTIHD